jgi:transposase
MIIKLVKADKSDRVRVYLVEGYRDGTKVKQRIVKKYGNLQELQKDDPNILDKLRAEAKRLSAVKKEDLIPMILDMSKKNEASSTPLNIGCVYVSSLIDSLLMKDLFADFQKRETFEYDLYEAMKFLVIMRILHPGSKRESFYKKEELTLKFDLTLDDVYRSLSHLERHRTEITRHLDRQMTERYERNKTLVYYDVTNYYFESNETSELREVGCSKQNSKHPIVTMGLYIDQDGYPISYDLFKGNVHDSKTLIPSFEKIREELAIEKCIIVADKGLNSGTNIKYILESGNGYIFSSKIRGQAQGLIDAALDENDYVQIDKDFKYKQFQYKRKVPYLNEMGRTKTFEVTENMVVFYSADYDRKAKHERERLLEKLEYYIDQPGRLKDKTHQGKFKYLKQEQYDAKTGEELHPKLRLQIDEDKVKEDAKLDGYYLIVTNELSMAGTDIIRNYRGLWAIERSFRIIKSELEGRPIYLSTDEHIMGHFFTCFMALLVERILERRIKNRFGDDEPVSTEAIQKALRDMNVLMIENDIYKIMKYSPVQQKIQETFENGVIDKEYIRKEHLNQALKKV